MIPAGLKGRFGQQSETGLNTSASLRMDVNRFSDELAPIFKKCGIKTRIGTRCIHMALS